MAEEVAPVVVVGAGIAGLTAAFRLRSAGYRVRVLEAATRAGGTVRSVRDGGHMFEHGPTTVPSTAPRLASLIDDCGLRSKAVLSQPVAGRRLVWRWDRLHALPEKPTQLFSCTALGIGAKLRLMAEPFIPAKKPGSAPETLGEFGCRRLGQGAVDAFLDPFITGIFAGQLDRLGVDAVPRLLDLEAEHGSLLRGLIRGRKKARRQAAAEGRVLAKGPPPLISFADGLETLPAYLASGLGESLELRRRVVGIDRHRGGFRVQADDGVEAVDASAVIVTAPSQVAARLLPPEAEAGFLNTLPHPFVATVGLGFARHQLLHALDAFGLLVASDSRYLEADVLGVLFSSSIFAGRAPEGAVTLTVMIGGSRDPGAAELDDDALIQRARGAVSRFLGASGEPTAVAVARWPRAIPQLLPGHRQRVADLRQRLKKVPGLALAGNYLDGVGVEASVASADAAVASVLENAVGMESL